MLARLDFSFSHSRRGATRFLLGDAKFRSTYRDTWSLDRRRRVSARSGRGFTSWTRMSERAFPWKSIQSCATSATPPSASRLLNFNSRYRRLINTTRLIVRLTIYALPYDLFHVGNATFSAAASMRSVETSIFGFWHSASAQALNFSPLSTEDRVCVLLIQRRAKRRGIRVICYLRRFLAVLAASR